jgi:phosphatidylserine/phosphatidylglycerophosphate/cardiolipin synthase-like enzyme
MRAEELALAHTAPILGLVAMWFNDEMAEAWKKGFARGSGVVEALVRAEQRAVDGRLIADKMTPCRRASAIGPGRRRVLICNDDQPRIAHTKTMVIDGAVTLMGSYKWTTVAAQNYEDLNLILSPTVAAAYAAHWHERLAVSVRFNHREDWCWS